MQKIIKIKGMTCGHCERRVQKNLKGICGVTSADVSATDKKAIVELIYEVDSTDFETAVKESGYEVIGIE